MSFAMNNKNYNNFYKITYIKDFRFFDDELDYLVI